MLGGRAKRLGDYKGARLWYSRGAEVFPNSTYILVNLAAVSLLAEPHQPDEAIRFYKRLIDIVQEAIKLSPDEWAELLLGEAFFVLGKQDLALRHFAAAKNTALSPKSLESAARQLELFEAAGFRAAEARELVDFLRTNNNQDVGADRGSKSDVKADKPTQAFASSNKLPILVHLSDIHFGHAEKDGKRKDMHRFYEGENS